MFGNQRQKSSLLLKFSAKNLIPELCLKLEGNEVYISDEQGWEMRIG